MKSGANNANNRIYSCGSINFKWNHTVDCEFGYVVDREEEKMIRKEKLFELLEKWKGQMGASAPEEVAKVMIEIFIDKVETIPEEELATDINVGDKWIPTEHEVPADNRYILLSFENYTLLAIGRYEEAEDGSGNFHIGDEERSCLSLGLIVNAWQELPERYKGEKHGNI